MRFLDLITFATQALLRFRLRTALSILGVSIGVLAVLILTALGEGARRYVVGQFATIGTNILIVFPGKTETSGAIPGFGGVPNDLTLDDAEALQRGIPGARLLAPLSMGNETVAFRERSRQVAVIGTTHAFFEMRELKMHTGRCLPPGDMRRGAPVTVLGRDLARELFGNDPAVGQVVRIGGWRMRVIGVAAEKGTFLGFNVDEVALVPVATGMKMFNRTSLFRIQLKVEAATELEAVRDRVRHLLIERHGEEDITCVSQDAVIQTFTSILSALTFALAGIAAISLTVAGVGIMNVLLVSVSERTAEVGLLKALGAKQGQILAVFLAEAVVLSVSGGLVGLVAGEGLVWCFGALYPAFPVATPLWAVITVILLSLGVGTVFGVLPALKATRLDPIQALAGR